MMDPHDRLLGYYYFGFHSALVRYRVLTIQGWVVTAFGAAGLLVFWRDGSDLFTIAVALCAAVAGLSLVHQSVAALDQYVRVPYPGAGSRVMSRGNRGRRRGVRPAHGGDRQGRMAGSVCRIPCAE